MKILYMSCHEILEFDEVKLLTELNHDVYSLGAYTQPGGEEHRKRPAIPGLPYDPHFIELALQFDRRMLNPEQLEGFDAVIVMHSIEFLTLKDDAGNETGNWPLFKKFIANGGRVIWRSIGQSIPSFEDQLRPLRDDGLEIVRYSPRESTIVHYVGSDALIRFYKDPEEYKGYNGTLNQVINFTQSLKSRGRFCGFGMFMDSTRSIEERRVYGPGNEDMGPLDGSLLSYENQKKMLRDSRANFYHGTYPASYTLSFIEAFMTGMPIGAVGIRHGNGADFPLQRSYEIGDIIENGVNGFISDDPRELEGYFKQLMNDLNLALAISAKAREKAIELFGREIIAEQWQRFLGGAEN